jgi:hypothetical protein
MKSLPFFVIAVLLFSGCRNETSADKPVVKTEKPASLANSSEKTLDVPWITVQNDSTDLLEIRKNPAAHPANLNEQDIIDALNLKYPQIQITALSREGNTAVVKIADATYLCEQMGSTGARAYLAEATYSLTEVAGIQAVDFRFKAGDHATPGILTRSSFEDFN